MAIAKTTTTATDAPEALPQAGGSYTRQPDGTLQPATAAPVDTRADTTPDTPQE